MCYAIWLMKSVVTEMWDECSVTHTPHTYIPLHGILIKPSIRTSSLSMIEHSEKSSLILHFVSRIFIFICLAEFFSSFFFSLKLKGVKEKKIKNYFKSIYCKYVLVIKQYLIFVIMCIFFYLCQETSRNPMFYIYLCFLSHLTTHDIYEHIETELSIRYLRRFPWAESFHLRVFT